MENGYKATKIFNKEFVLFAVAWECYMIGHELLRFALPMYILIMTGDTALLGMVLSLSTIPRILLFPIGGAFVDIYNKRKILLIFNFLTALTIFIYLWSTDFLSVIPAAAIMLAILITLDVMLSSSCDPMIPLLVPKDKLKRANSISFLMAIVSSIGAPIIAGFLMERYGIFRIGVISASLYVVAGILQLFYKIPYRKIDRDTPLPQKIVTDVKEGIYYLLKENRELGKLMIITLSISATLYPIMTIGVPALVHVHLGFDSWVLGVVKGIAAFGGVVGTLLMNLLGERIKVEKAKALLGVPSALLGVLGVMLLFGDGIIALSVVVLLVFLITLFISPFGIITWTWMMEKCEQTMLGRVSANYISLMLLGYAIGDFLWGELLSIFKDNPSVVLLVMSGLALLVATKADFEKK